jgi:hypothetical protein
MLVHETRVAESSGYMRENITTTGSGQAHIFQNGTVIEATWSRNSIKDQLVFTAASGDPIEFVPGQIWISAYPHTTGAVAWQ